MPFENRYLEITVNSNESNLKIIPLLPNNKIAGSQYLTIIKFQCKIRTDKAVFAAYLNFVCNQKPFTRRTEFLIQCRTNE